MPDGGDRKFALSILENEPGSVSIELYLRESKKNWQTYLAEFSEQYAKDYYAFDKEMRSEVGKALIGALAKKGGG